MKLEFDITDITREHLVDAMAEKLLTTYVHDHETNSGYRSHSALAEQMEIAIKQRIDELAEEWVRKAFDETIRARIGAVVDEVLATGWVRTDSYGNRIGDGMIDLKGRISEIITTKTREGYNGPERTLAEKLVQEKVAQVLSAELDKEIRTARESLRAQLDTVIAGKVAATIKQALGLS